MLRFIKQRQPLILLLRQCSHLVLLLFLLIIMTVQARPSSAVPSQETNSLLDSSSSSVSVTQLPPIISAVQLQRTIIENYNVTRVTRNQRSAAAAEVYGELDESTVRNERSTNLSHITGTARKIQMFVKNRHLQILPDGTVNGTSDDTSDFTILQRSSVNTGELQIQGVATCLFLCMDTCGLLYGAMQFTEECIFRENIEQDHYNTYSSVRHSDNRKTLYLALDGKGVPRKVQVTAARQKRQQKLASSSGGSLGKLSTYARVLTRHVHNSRVEELAKRLLIQRQSELTDLITSSVEGFRHHGYNHLCPITPSSADTVNRTGVVKCSKRGQGGGIKKNNNKKNNAGGQTKNGGNNKRKKRKRKCIDEEDADKCRRERKKRKNNLKNKKGASGKLMIGPKRKQQQQQRTTITTTTESILMMPTTLASSTSNSND